MLTTAIVSDDDDDDEDDDVVMSVLHFVYFVTCHSRDRRAIYI